VKVGQVKQRSWISAGEAMIKCMDTTECPRASLERSQLTKTDETTRLSQKYPADAWTELINIIFESQVRTNWAII
jgi:hypothetical protein